MEARKQTPAQPTKLWRGVARANQILYGAFAMTSAQTRVAKIIEAVLNPFVTFTALFVVVVLAVSWQQGALIYIALELAAVGICITYLFVRWYLNRMSDYWVYERSKRIVPAVVFLGVGAFLYGTLVLLSAPHEVVATVGAVYIASIITTVTTLVWKISVHTMVAGYVAAGSFLFVGMWGILFLAGVVSVVWARVIYGAHTVSQAVGGACLGAAVSTLFLGHT